MAKGDLSLWGQKDYAISKGGVPSDTWEYNDLRDLEALLDEMDAIRSGDSTEGCSSHGDEVDYDESKTKCSNHSFDYNSRSLGQIQDAIDNLQSCSCDSHKEMYCDCNDNQEMCNCNSEY